MLRENRRRAILTVVLCLAGSAVLAALTLYLTHSAPRLEVAILLPGGPVPPKAPQDIAVSIPGPVAPPQTGTGGATLAQGQWDATPTGGLTTELPAAAASLYADLPPAPGPEPLADVPVTPELPSEHTAADARHTLFRLPPLEPGKPRSGGLTILQIGDSHTAADFFTGEVRQLLQARFGDGGIGYLNAGKPHPGVRSAIVRVTASPGWTYAALQKTGDTEQFYLSGFNASVSGTGETLAFAASQPSPFDMIEVEAVFGPGHGGISIAIDDLPPVAQTLDATANEKRVFRITPARGARYDFRKMAITTTGGGQVTIASVGVFNHAYGVSYSAIGFPGATVDIANQINSKVFGEELHRIDPHIVVLAFGTNEGFNDNLDLAHYGERYRLVLKKIRESLPQARIVLVAPPNANRLPGSCKAAGATAACKPPGAGEPGCFWSTPPMLDKVRELQRKIAAETNASLWNWGEITPGECGAHALVNAMPRLMTPDHVHFTGDGYRLGARAFAKFLIPFVEQMRLPNDAVSNR